MAGINLKLTTLFLSTIIILSSHVLHETYGRAVYKETIQELADEFFKWRLTESPEYALKYGFLPYYEDGVEEWNEAAFGRRVKQAKEFYKRANQVDVASIKDRNDVISLKLLKINLDTYISGYEYRNFTVGFNNALMVLPNNMERAGINDVWKLVKWMERIQAYTKMIKEQIEVIPKTVASNMTLTCLQVEAIIMNLQQQTTVSRIEDFFAFQPWQDLNVSAYDKKLYEKGEITCRLLHQAMVSLMGTLYQNYDETCRYENIGASSLPDGQKYYTKALQFHTMKHLTPEAVHDMGVKEVDRISVEFNKIIKAAGFKTQREYVDDLLTKPGETFKTKEEALAEVEKIYKTIKPRVSLVLPFDVTAELDITHAEGGGMGSYARASEDGKQPAQFLMDASTPENILKINLLPVTLHEAVPGHHLSMTNYKHTELPHFRKYLEYRHLSQVPFNWPTFTSYIEGWALYAETLSEELGFKLTDKERFGMLTFENLRAVRMVVDTGLNYYNWSLDYAIAYMREKTTLTEQRIYQEIYRYINWPGQACAYKIGEMKIKDLREMAEFSLGSKFDLREFHRVVLSVGPSPLEIVEEEVKDWIHNTKYTLPTTSNGKKELSWVSIAGWLKHYLRM